MAAKVWIGTEPRAAYLRRLAVVFADELRLKIVTELYMREMSASQFCAEFGGGSVSRVDGHFKVLAAEGWLSFIRSESGGRRRGGTEHFYRATQLAVFDYETWCLLPYSVRVAFSWTILKQMVERVRAAVEAGTFDARPNRRLTCTSLLVDQAGWERVIAAVDALFVSLFEEQADARLRIFHSGEKPLQAVVGLAAFESPAPGGGRVGPKLAVSGKESPFSFPVRLSKVFDDELYLQILGEANLRQISAPQIYRELGGDTKAGIRRRIKTLARTDWLTKVAEKTGGRRRGAIEYFYRATGPAISDSGIWAGVPDSVKAAESWTTFEQLVELILMAMRAGTFDIREDRHLTWSLLRLDLKGWARVATAVDALLRLILEEQELAKARLKESGEKPIPMTVGLAAFESPKDSAKAP